MRPHLVERGGNQDAGDVVVVLMRDDREPCSAKGLVDASICLVVEGLAIRHEASIECRVDGEPALWKADLKDRKPDGDGVAITSVDEGTQRRLPRVEYHVMHGCRRGARNHRSGAADCRK